MVALMAPQVSGRDFLWLQPVSLRQRRSGSSPSAAAADLLISASLSSDALLLPRPSAPSALARPAIVSSPSLSKFTFKSRPSNTLPRLLCFLRLPPCWLIGASVLCSITCLSACLLPPLTSSPAPPGALGMLGKRTFNKSLSSRTEQSHLSS